jgi:cation diffusion facilitator CzcD-associated flavoprotein CzcO
MTSEVFGTRLRKLESSTTRPISFLRGGIPASRTTRCPRTIRPIPRTGKQWLTSAYAETFGILDRIQFNTTVESVERTDEGWLVQIAGSARPRLYRALVIASGHHDIPRVPNIPGKFTGEIMHSRDYRSVKQLADKRVVVIGAGNSACDIVVDATSVARAVYQSFRRGTFFVPKFMLGRPTDGIVNFCEKLRMPRGLRNRIYTI